MADEKLGHPRVVLTDDVEVFKTWPGVGFDEVYAEAARVEGSRGLRVASLHQVLAFKLVTDREEDRPSAKLTPHRSVPPVAEGGARSSDIARC